MTLWQNVRGKLVVTAVLVMAVWFASGLVGFPTIFRLYFVGYALIALPFFVLLDMRFGTQPRHGGLAIVAVFLIASAILILVGRLLPQYDPQVEQEKIARIQRSLRERQKPRRIEALRKEAEELGLVVVEPGQVAQAPTGTEGNPGASAGGLTSPVEAAGPSPELIERGRLAYDDWECYNCHKIGGKGGVKRRGPELDNIGNLLSTHAIRAEILNPTSSLAEGFEEEYNKVTMPDDFGKRLSDDEINALAAYLSTLTDASVASPTPLFPGTARGDQGSFYEISLEYQKTMPPGWWTDPEIIAKGKAIYEGQVYPDVVCAACHGRDGVPILSGAADFRDLDLIEGWSDAYWYWRIAKGVPDTPMTPWEEKLTPEEIFKVIAYENTFAYDGEPTDHGEMFYPPEAEVK
ncbi:MAG: c-type cytochrome [Anaerolineae bacterium]